MNKHFALAGNPNSGKTTLFNSLTGSTAHVGNWPGVTVDKREGTYKKLSEPIDIIDLPGIYSLSPYTSEEIVSRNYILDEKPDCVINVVDGTNLERNLYLTTQLLEIDVPVVVALNMSDVLRKRGNSIELDVLSKRLGVPVIAISALKEENLDGLMIAAYEASKNKREGFSVIENKDLFHLIRDIKIAFEGKGVENPLFHATKLVELDEIESKMHEDLLPMVEAFKQTFEDDTFGSDFEALIADARYQFITEHFHDLFPNAEKQGETKEKKLTTTDKVDRVLTHRIWGLPIFAVVMFLIFHLTFSENLFFTFANIESEGWINFFTGMRYEGEAMVGIPSPGIFLQNWFGWFTDSLIIGNLASVMPEAWYTSLLLDGVLAGLSAVLSFVPQILLLFVFIAILEDSGYMARIAFILDRAFRRFGLS
ncbi:MAG: ferrous iron transporter B, partial [Bacilli bacterium]|nr:ferrous iron transporter B [Bacilli bacterium]